VREGFIESEADADAVRMRQFRRRGLIAVGAEWALATTAYNLTRLFSRRRSAQN